MTSNIMKRGTPVFEEEEDVEVAATAALSSLKMLEVFARDNPSNKNYAVLLARSYGNYAFGFLENDILQYKDRDRVKYDASLARAKLFYRRGRDYGLDILKRSGRFRNALSKDSATFEEMLKGYGRGDLDLLFWTGFCWGNLINLSKDDPSAITDLGRVQAMMARVFKLQETYFYASPHLFYGVYYASRPPMLGGSPQKAKDHFEDAVKFTQGKFLMAEALEAQFYAVQVQDKALFYELLQRVLDTPGDLLPQQRLANELAKRRARILLDRIDNYF
ncbi:MAG: TRAP transporter TatT component family protein [Deltaproteobacteria bacterium]|nr:TRAP transporter TatT component family protein [Deltaproteobacteria bacterium]